MVGLIKLDVRPFYTNSSLLCSYLHSIKLIKPSSSTTPSTRQSGLMVEKTSYMPSHHYYKTLICQMIEGTTHKLSHLVNEEIWIKDFYFTVTLSLHNFLWCDWNSVLTFTPFANWKAAHNSCNMQRVPVRMIFCYTC